MSAPFQIQRRIEFRDTDTAGIAHFSVFFTLMEQTEHELFRSIGLSVMQPEPGAATKISWPRVSAACDYKSAVRFEDLVDIQLAVSRLGEKSVEYSHTFLHGDRLVASGKITTVCCRIDNNHHLASIEIPDEIRQRLSEFLLPAKS